MKTFLIKTALDPQTLRKYIEHLDENGTAYKFNAELKLP